MKTILKLAVAALILHASWRAGSAAFRYYSFTDEVQQSVLFGARKSDAELQKAVAEIAHQMQLPLAPESISVHRDENHIFVDTRYTERIELVPTFYYPYEFKMNLDVLSLGAGPAR